MMKTKRFILCGMMLSIICSLFGNVNSFATESTYQEGKAVKLGRVSKICSSSQRDGSVSVVPYKNGDRVIDYNITPTKSKKTVYKMTKEKSSTKHRKEVVVNQKTYVITLMKNFRWKIEIFSKKGKKLTNKTISLKKMLSSKEKDAIKKYRYYNLFTNDIQVVGKNKLEVAYSTFFSKKKPMHGGIAKIDIKKGTVSKKNKFNFDVRCFKGDYAFGLDHSFYAEYLGGLKNTYYCCQRISTGEMVYKVADNYGEEESKKTYDANNQVKSYEGFPEHEYPHDFSPSYSWQSGNMIFSNLDGIYYVSAKQGKVEKILDYADMKYYSNNRYLYSVSMKSKNCFSVIYTDDGLRCSNTLYAVNYSRS